MSNPKTIRMVLPVRGAGHFARPQQEGASIADYGDPEDNRVAHAAGELSEWLARASRIQDAPKTKAAVQAAIKACRDATVAYQQEFNAAMVKKYDSGAQGSPRNW